MTRRGSQGFTLIEMVIALAILALMLTALYSAFEHAVNRVRHDAHLSEGTLLAQSLLSRAGAEWPVTTSSHEGEWNGYTYHLSIETPARRSADPPRSIPVLRVTANVSWPESGGVRTLTLSTFKFKTAGNP